MRRVGGCEHELKSYPTLFRQQRSLRIVDSSIFASNVATIADTAMRRDELNLELAQETIEICATETQTVHRLRRDDVRCPLVRNLN